MKNLQHETWKVSKSFENNENMTWGASGGVSATNGFQERQIELPLMFFLCLLAPIGRFEAPFWHPSDFEEVPKSTTFETNRTTIEKKEVHEEALNIFVFLSILGTEIRGLKLEKRGFRSISVANYEI